MKSLRRALDLGLRVVFYVQEEEPNTEEKGPYRAQIYKCPVKTGDFIITASGPDLESVFKDLGNASEEMLQRVGLPVVWTK